MPLSDSNKSFALTQRHGKNLSAKKPPSAFQLGSDGPAALVCRVLTNPRLSGKQTAASVFVTAFAFYIQFPAF
jgi:hypothetical protein